MEFFIPLAVLIILFFSYRYIRALFIRLSFAARLRKLCGRKKFKLYTNSFFWLTGLTPNNGCDFYVETKKTVFSVKFLFTPYKSGSITFIGSEEYFHDMPRIESPTNPVERKHRIHKLNYIDFNYKMRQESFRKRIDPYVLISPSCRHVWFIPNLGATETEIKLIGETSWIDYFTIISQHKLLTVIEEAE